MDQISIFFLVVIIIALTLGGVGIYSAKKEKHQPVK